MSDEHITNYYLLCTIRAGGKKHVISEIPDKDLALVVTKKEYATFFKGDRSSLAVRESVIGGSGGINGSTQRVTIVL